MFECKLVSAKQVDELKIVLAEQEIELKKKNQIADRILVEVRAENAKAEAEKAVGETLKMTGGSSRAR